VEKMPFKSLPPKGESKKSMKKKKRSKRQEDMISSPKHYDPLIDYDNSDWDDVPMPVTCVSDHDWEKHSTFDLEIFWVPILRLIIVVPLVLSMFLLMMICLMSMFCEIAVL
jgi:hypothetical protein